MWDFNKKDPGIVLSEYATIARQTTSTLGSVIGI
jgi:hypothetical protein